jgi:hypothetical protein
VLLRTLFAIALLSALAETMLHAVDALAQSALRRQALLSLHDEVANATSAAHNAIAASIAAGADPRSPDPSPPAIQPTCSLRVRDSCAIEGVAVVRFTAATQATASPCPDDGCTVYRQEDDAVDEGRIDVTIAARARAHDGAVLASRDVRLTFRTLRVSPYAALTGQADVTAGVDERSGNDAGAAPMGAAPGTLIDVVYENAVTGAKIPANVWHAQTERKRGAPAAWKP